MPCEFRSKDMISQDVFKHLVKTKVFCRISCLLIVRVQDISNNSPDCTCKNGNNLCPYLSITQVVSLNEHLFLINAWFLLAMWAFYFLEHRHSLYLVVITNVLLRWINGNMSLTVCECHVTGTLQEAIMDPLASLSELSHSKV